MKKVALKVAVTTYAKAGVDPKAWTFVKYARQELLRKRRDTRRRRPDTTALEHCQKVIEIADTTAQIVAAQTVLNAISTKQYNCPGCDYSQSEIDGARVLLQATSESNELYALASVTAVTAAPSVQKKKGKL